MEAPPPPPPQSLPLLHQPRIPTRIYKISPFLNLPSPINFAPRPGLFPLPEIAPVVGLIEYPGFPVAPPAAPRTINLIFPEDGISYFCQPYPIPVTFPARLKSEAYCELIQFTILDGVLTLIYP